MKHTPSKFKLDLDLANYHKNIKKGGGIRKRKKREFKFLTDKFGGRKPN